MNNVIIYEQPLNEHIRACLRLEHLFTQINDTIDLPSVWASRTAMESILKILGVIDRPDLKNKISKALYQHASILTQYEKSSDVDQGKLRSLLDELDGVIDKLYASPGRLVMSLYENDFLSSIRSHMHNPGGPVNFSLPAYQLWLSQSAPIRSHELKIWVSEFNLLDQAVRLLLQLTRQFSKPEKIMAHEGFYQRSLDPNISGEMARVIVNGNYFTEISVGKHRLAVRFYEGDVFSKARQTTSDVEFKLLLCAV